MSGVIALANNVPLHFDLFAMPQHIQPTHDDDLAVETARPKLKRPPLYNVILLNDDYTPMEFVVHVLEYFFGLNREDAIRIMLKVHTQGKGLCGQYSREIAETKVAKVNDYARVNEHPLVCSMEPA